MSASLRIEVNDRVQSQGTRMIAINTSNQIPTVSEERDRPFPILILLQTVAAIRLNPICQCE